MNHVVFRDEKLNGWEYGMLRSFESSIVQETGATIFPIPGYEFAARQMHYFGQGMKRASYRRYFPKKEMDVSSDVAWYILMGPENYRLDLYKNWELKNKIKILYLYDTLPGQYPLIKKLFSNNTWDVLITSFNDAVDDLQRITGRKWLCIEQAADTSLFQPVSIKERLIHFSSYGRRYPVLHETLKEFCLSNELYYDYTTHDAKHPVVDATELYRQYAWHITHSVFTLSWPVELTNPARAGHLHPITCRWFEAAAAGTVILGKSPANAVFDEWIGRELVVDLNPELTRQELFKKLESIWDQRESLLDKAAAKVKSRSESWSWNDRVHRILKNLS